MSRAGGEEEEDQCFHDSLDRLISSTNTSCSSSALPSDEDEDRFISRSGSPNYAGPNALSVPCFPVSVSDNYDVWISEPSSVDERRINLLRKIGLNHDPSILRHRPSLSAAEGSSSGYTSELLGRSVWSNQLKSGINNGEAFLKNRNKNCNVSWFVRSKSEDSSHSSGYGSNSVGSPICKSTENISIDSTHPWSLRADKANGGSPVAVSTSSNLTLSIRNVDRLQNGSGLPLAEALQQKKPPTSCDFGNVEAAEVLNPDGVNDRVEIPVCIIKDLDNGKAFIVNEVREDGTWNKLKEVGTGQQLTMEEFEICVGTSPIVQELMRRQNVDDSGKDGLGINANGSGGSGFKFKKTRNWLKSIRNVANSFVGNKDWCSSDEKDSSSERCGRRSSSATDDSQYVSSHGHERVRVRHYGKSCKELTSLYKCQEIHAHNGSIWSIKFSLDGKYLASAGEDCVIHVWQVTESERRTELLFDKPEDPNKNLLLLTTGSPDLASVSPNFDGHMEKRRGRPSISRKSVGFDHVVMPETVFALSEKPTCSFKGHVDNVLDLSWSKSQHLLSSSMDKTVRLWHLSSSSCLKIFSHSDYVTCIQFNPVDDRYFISGSLDAKVRIWSIPDRQVVDWNDLHEMVTAACYTPDGQGALVGSYKGSCHLYNTTENKLQQKDHINLHNKKKSHRKKITGFQFFPGSTSEVLVTSSDSRIRVIDGVDMVHKFKGFRNTNSQISASLSADGKYVICASEDSFVYVWKHEGDSRPGRNRGLTVTQSYEHFYCQDVSVAIPWPGMLNTLSYFPNEVTTNEAIACSSTTPICSGMGSYFFDRLSATWPEEKLLSPTKTSSPLDAGIDLSRGLNQTKPACGLVIVTATVRGEIKTFQNFGLPFRVFRG